MQQLIRPVIIRRLKAQVEKSLLPKKEQILFVGMSELQQKWYKNLIMRNFEELISKKIPYHMLMQLRKVCSLFVQWSRTPTLRRGKLRTSRSKL